jgi:amino acid transporter
MVLGPIMSFVAVSSIMVDYILTACISAVSAVLNASSFFPALSDSPHLVMMLVLASIWFVAGLNILGIRENVRFTFAIFMFAASWLKRLIIVVPPQGHPNLPIQYVPKEWFVYKPTLMETAITIASFLLAIIIITLLSKLFPVVPILETAHEENENEKNKD